MSLFRPYNYKPKPDLPSDAPVKNGFFLFFELFFRKFWRFVTVNIFYFLVTLPLLIVVYFTVNGYFADIIISESGEFQDMLAGVGILASVPPLFIAIWLQKTLVSGLASGGSKG